jgi:hypothetical protein
MPAAGGQLSRGVRLAEELVAGEAADGGKELRMRGWQRRIKGKGLWVLGGSAVEGQTGRAHGLGVVAALTSALGSIMRTQSCRQMGRVEGRQTQRHAIALTVRSGKSQWQA